MRSFQTILVAASTVVAANPALMARAPTGSFNLYAYGSGIGGVPVVYDGDTAYAGFPSVFNSTEAAPVLFELSNNVLTGSPNSTTNSSPTWSNVTLYIPAPTSSSHSVGFISGSSSNSSILTSGFMFYGQDVLHKSSSGTLETEWYAVPTDTEHIWTLAWNVTSDAVNGTVPISLRSAKPSTQTNDETDSTTDDTE
ncbi:hypothetical protein F5X96DRAFT_133467 [Biscogniauxia mediterranea]|nr:hypothetical protein F5X96DRAFT_133467 [Biscogniauxia mediterranea]